GAAHTTPDFGHGLFDGAAEGSSDLGDGLFDGAAEGSSDLGHGLFDGVADRADELAHGTENVVQQLWIAVNGRQRAGQDFVHAIEVDFEERLSIDAAQLELHSLDVDVRADV